jgi:hypothetical protein
LESDRGGSDPGGAILLRKELDLLAALKAAFQSIGARWEKISPRRPSGSRGICRAAKAVFSWKASAILGKIDQGEIVISTFV